MNFFNFVCFFDDVVCDVTIIWFFINTNYDLLANINSNSDLYYKSILYVDLALMVNFYLYVCLYM